MEIETKTLNQPHTTLGEVYAQTSISWAEVDSSLASNHICYCSSGHPLKLG